MYNKNLTEDIRLRLSKTDMDFLRRLSGERQVTVSEVARSIIGEYRRSLEAVQMLNDAIKLVGGAVHGDAETDFYNKL